MLHSAQSTLMLYTIGILNLGGQIYNQNNGGSMTKMLIFTDLRKTPGQGNFVRVGGISERHFYSQRASIPSSRETRQYE